MSRRARARSPRTSRGWGRGEGRGPGGEAAADAADATIEGAGRFGEAVAAALGVAPELHPAFEDPWELLRAEARLPVDVDPRTAGLDDPEERRRLARIFDRGAGSVGCHVLPLARSEDGWRTEHWKLR